MRSRHASRAFLSYKPRVPEPRSVTYIYYNEREGPRYKSHRARFLFPPPPPGWGPQPGFHDLVDVRYRLGMPNRGLVAARDPPARTLPGGRGPRDSIQVTLIYPATRGIRRWGAPAPAAHVGGGGMADMRQKPVRRRGGRQRTPTWSVMVLTCSNRGPLYVNCSTWSIARPPAAPRRRRARSRGACPIWAG